MNYAEDHCHRKPDQRRGAEGERDYWKALCRRYRDRDGNRLTDFISIKVRGPLAERCAEFAWKGCKLAAAGDFETISFADDPDRQPGFLIKATEVEFLSPRKVEEGVQAEAEAA